jgi:hypothetical protein
LTYLASVFILAGLGWRRFLYLLAGIVLIAGGLFAADGLLHLWGALDPLFHILLLSILALAVALPGLYQLISALKNGAKAG